MVLTCCTALLCYFTVLTGILAASETLQYPTRRFPSGLPFIRFTLPLSVLLVFELSSPGSIFLQRLSYSEPLVLWQLLPRLICNAIKTLVICTLAPPILSNLNFNGICLFSCPRPAPED